MASQQGSNRYQLRDSDRRALLVLLESDASSAGFENDDLSTINACNRDCMTRALSTRARPVSCAFTEDLTRLSKASYDPSKYSVPGSTDTTRLLERIRIVCLVLQAEHSRWDTEIPLTYVSSLVRTHADM